MDGELRGRVFGRRIGRLADGYEASFIAFGGDPMKDFEATRSIELRVKDGRILELGPAPPEPPPRQTRAASFAPFEHSRPGALD